MKKYIPKMYKKNIKEIDYDKIRKMNIKCLMFDLDNTLLEVHKTRPKKEVHDLIKKLKPHFRIFITSNNSNKRRVAFAANNLGVEFVRFAMKPFGRGFRKVKKKGGFEKKEMCIIGDQIMTDILGGNNYGIYTILVDPLSKEELKVTGFNRMLEKRVLNKLNDKNLFKKGEYYE